MAMNVNSVSNCTHIIRSQVEYSVSTQTVILRCIVEIPATGERRRGFAPLDALMDALRTELTNMQDQIVSKPNLNNKELR